jgi:hypothetical protein
VASAAAAVLAFFFPNEAAGLDAQAEEAAMSRLYGGIHYRFDSEVGVRMGRAIAALAIARERQRGTVAFTNRVGATSGF